MLTRIFSTMIAAILAILLLCVYPTYKAYEYKEDVVQTYVNTTVDSFQKQVRKKGIITKESYEDFLNALSRTGYTYDIDIMHTKPVCYPTSSQDGYTVLDDENNINIILSKLYNKTSPNNYKLDVGDNFVVSVTNKCMTETSIMTKINYTSIFARYGGMVQNEND